MKSNRTKPRWRWPAARRRRAFTLLETLIVVGILAILASIAIPAMRSTANNTVESAASILAADLRLARALAIQHNTEWTIRLDTAENSYELVHTGSGNPPMPANPLAPAGQPEGEYLVDFDDMGATSRSTSTVRLAGAALKGSRSQVAQVTFGPQGGTGPSRSEDTVLWLTAGTGGDTRYVRLTVSWVTGLVWVDEPEMFTGSQQVLSQ